MESNLKRNKKKFLTKSLSLLSVFLVACSNVKYKGEMKGNNRGAVNEIIIFADLSETVRMKSKISKPYSLEHKIDIGLPEYAETGLEIQF